jgi:hypothetical protein
MATPSAPKIIGELLPVMPCVGVDDASLGEVTVGICKSVVVVGLRIVAEDGALDVMTAMPRSTAQ